MFYACVVYDKREFALSQNYVVYAPAVKPFLVTPAGHRPILKLQSWKKVLVVQKKKSVSLKAGEPVTI